MKRVLSSTFRLAHGGGGFGTKCVHSGTYIDQYSGAVNVPICMSSTFEQKHPGQNYEADCMYTRLRNPSRTAIEEQIADLEGGKYAHVASSGMGSITNVITTLKDGDHILCTKDVYGGTHETLENIFCKMGLEASFVDFCDLEDFESGFQDNTKLVWGETVTNPTLKICDIEKIAEISHKHNAIVGIDNTFATPYLCRPLELGVDVVMHSCTKYINGHADVVMGATVCNDDELHEEIYYRLKTVGAVPSPFDCYLAMRGAKTLHVRMDRIQENAMKIAQFLEGHEKIQKVIFPGLESHPQHDIAKKQLSGFGGMITMYIDGDLEESERFLTSLNTIILAVSLGGVESLAEHPALQTHRGVPEEMREAVNITNNLVRLSVGIEDVDDLIEDLDEALKRV